MLSAIRATAISCILIAGTAESALAQVTIARTGVSYPTIAAAYAASQSGDTLDIRPGTYTNHDLLVGHDITFVGDGPPGSVVWDAASAGQAVTKGLLIAGQQGTVPNVTVRNIVFENATNNILKVARNCLGVEIPAGSPTQCGSGGNGAGIRYQSGNLTVIGSYFYHDQDGIMGEPFVHGAGSITVENSFADQDGAGDGVSHNFYLGRVAVVTFIGNKSCNSWTGHTLKIRAVKAIVRDNVLGDCPTFAPVSRIGGNWNGATSNELQLPDGSDAIISGNTFIKGPNAQNPFLVELGGQVPYWAGSRAAVTGSTFQDDYGARALLWNFMNNANVSVTGNRVTGSRTPHAVLLGMGSQSGNGAFAATSQTTYPVLTGGMQHLTNLQTSSGAQSVVLRTGDFVLGGHGHLTVTGNAAGTEVLAGTGGTTVTSNTDFVDSAGDAPTTYTGTPPAVAAAVADGDVLNITRNGYGYADFSGRSQTLNDIGDRPNCVIAFVKPQTRGVVPSVTVNQNPCRSAVIIVAGGTVRVTGRGSVGLLEGYAAPGVAEADATFEIDLDGETGRFTGQGMEISGPRVYEYTDPSTHDLFEPRGDSRWAMYLDNGTVDFGNSTASTAWGQNNIAARDLVAAVVAGSGSGTFIVGSGPTIIEDIQGYGGGTLTIRNYSIAHARETHVALLGGVTAGSAGRSGEGTTMQLSDGTRLVFSGGAAVNDSPLPGSRDAELAVAAIAATPGRAAPIRVRLADVWAGRTSGEGLIRLTALGQGTITLGGARGKSEQMKGRLKDILPALATATYTPSGAGASDTVLVEWWNQGGAYSATKAPVTFGR
jgi:hypothetical protein